MRDDVASIRLVDEKMSGIRLHLVEMIADPHFDACREG